MRVLVYSGNTWNGIWSHSHELAKNLAKYKKTTYLSVPACQDPAHPNLNKKADYKVPKLTIATSNITFEKFELPYFLFTQLYTIFTFFTNKADVYFLYNTFDLPFFFLAKIFGKKTYFMYVDDYVALAKTPFFKTLARIGTWLMFKLSNGVFCTAKTLEQTAREYNKNVYYTPNCVNLADAKHLKQKTRKEFIIGFVGTLGHWVKTDIIIDIAKTFKDAKVLVVGGGEGLAQLKKAKLSNLELTGFMPHDKVYEQVSQFDIAIIPFAINKITNAVSPVKLFEFWLAKKPAVCSKTTELMQFKDTALLAVKNEDFIKQIQTLKNSPELRRELGEKGYELVKEKYNWSEMIKEYLEAI